MDEARDARHCLCQMGPMRSYANSIALYERTRKHLAGGVNTAASTR
jgi:hypothetical protein